MSVNNDCPLSRAIAAPRPPWVGSLCVCQPDLPAWLELGQGGGRHRASKHERSHGRSYACAALARWTVA